MYNLNINKSSIVPTNLIVGRVLDKPFDTIQFKIHDGLDVMDLTGCTLEFRGTTPDNKKVTSNAIKILDAKSGEIEFTFPPNFYSAKGHFQNAYFVIKKGTNSESTNDLLITVLNAVDFNLDDAPIIIDQLDDLIQAVIDDINKQLSTVKLDIKQTQDNITALKKDVDAYKGQFNTEIARMQKQLDDLAKAINQTDIQRPQITAPNGAPYEVWGGQYQLIDKVRQLGRGFRVVRATCDTVGQLPTTGVFLLTVNVSEINGSNVNQAHLYAHTGGGHMWYTYIYANRYSGWKQVTLDGQVPKVTSNDGNQYSTLDDKNKSSVELLSSLPNGIQSVYLRTATDLPDGQRVIGVKQSINTNIDGQFTGVAVGGGNTYSITYSSGSSRDGWKRLDGQVPKITQDDGSFRHIVSESTIDTYDYITSLGSGTFSIYLHTTKGQPENFIAGIVTQTKHSSGKMEGIFIGSALSTGNVYSYAYASSGVKGWKRLDRLEYGIATQTQNGLLSSTDKKKLDGLEKHSDATQSKSGLMSSTDKVKLDGLDYSISTKFVPSGNASLSSHSSLPQTIERDGKFVTFKVVLTGAIKGEVVGTIPPEYRPTYKVFKICPSNANKPMRVFIGTNGVVEFGSTPKGIEELTKEESVMLTFTYKI